MIYQQYFGQFFAAIMRVITLPDYRNCLFEPFFKRIYPIWSFFKLSSTPKLQITRFLGQKRPISYSKVSEPLVFNNLVLLILSLFGLVYLLIIREPSELQTLFFAARQEAWVSWFHG